MSFPALQTLSVCTLALYIALAHTSVFSIDIMNVMILDIKHIFEVCYLKYFHNGNINSSQMVTTIYSTFSRLGKPKPFINICFQIEVIIKISKGNVLHLLVEID